MTVLERLSFLVSRREGREQEYVFKNYWSERHLLNLSLGTDVAAGFPGTCFRALRSHVTYLLAASVSILKTIHSELQSILLQELWSLIVVVGRIFPFLIPQLSGFVPYNWYTAGSCINNPFIVQN